MVEFRIVVQFLAIKSSHKSLPSYGLSKTPCHKWRATVRQINQSINPSINQSRLHVSVHRRLSVL